MTPLVNSHVLIPHLANWRNAPTWSRSWQNEISPAVTGHESRNSLRAQPRVSLTALITPWSVPVQNQLDDAIRAAKKSGFGCMPFWGRGSILAQDCNSQVLQLASAFWPWKVNDYVYFLYDALALQFEVRQIIGAEGAAPQLLTLDQAPAQTIAAGKICWPLIFGKFDSDTMAAETAQRGAVAVTISEMISPATAAIGVVNIPPASGIGAMAINNDFQVNAP